jgi:5,10-methylenetetrahydromethanopterin reductase
MPISRQRMPGRGRVGSEGLWAREDEALQGLPKLSVRLHGGLTPQQCVAQAQAAEAAGLDGIAFAENPFNRGILPAAAACAVATSRIRIGAGVFNPYSRHPTLIAMDIGALDELAQGRVRLGIGSGIGWAIERMGFRYERPLTTVREAIAIIRALLRGDEVSHAGVVFNVQKVKLDYRARADIPIFMAGRGDHSLQACGELADGLIVSNMCTAPFVATAVQVLHGAAQAAGRPAMPEVVQYLPCITQPDRAEAQRRATQAVAEMLPAYWALGQRLPAAKRALLEGSDISEAEFAAAVGRLQQGAPAATVLDERYSAAFTLAGTAEDCRAQAAAYAAAGVTEIALTFSGANAAADMATVAKAMSG